VNKVDEALSGALHQLFIDNELLSIFFCICCEFLAPSTIPCPQKPKQNCFCQVESECTSYNYRLFAIFVPKIIRVD